MNIFGVKIFGVKIFWVKFFWVKFFFNEIFLTPPPSRARGRGEGGEVVDRPTQLFYIWIFFCLVGGGEPCGHEELSLSGSSMG